MLFIHTMIGVLLVFVLSCCIVGLGIATPKLFLHTLRQPYKDLVDYFVLVVTGGLTLIVIVFLVGVVIEGITYLVNR